jgi:hypothetical protein
MFSNSRKMIEVDRIMSELWYIVCKKYNFNISAFVDCIVWLFINARKLITLPFKSAQLLLSPWLIWQHQILVSVLQPTNEE